MPWAASIRADEYIAISTVWAVMRRCCRAATVAQLRLDTNSCTVVMNGSTNSAATARGS